MRRRWRHNDCGSHFRTALQRDIDAIGGKAVVEIHLVSGRSQRLRAVLGIEKGYVVLDAYRNKGGETSAPEWNEQPREGAGAFETERTVVAYESIASVHVTSAAREAVPRVGVARAVVRL